MAKTPEERAAATLARHEKTFLKFARDDGTWKRVFADAVLNLLKSKKSITPDDIRQAIRDGIERPIRITGTDMAIEFSREASQAAIEHLDAVVRPLDGE